MNILSILLILFFCTSCAKVQYLSEALTLKAYSDEKDAQAVAIADNRKQVASLLSRIASGDTLADFKTASDWEAAFGAPVLVEPTQDADVVRWLYRDPLETMNVPRVYVFVDGCGRVQNWRLEDNR